MSDLIQATINADILKVKENINKVEQKCIDYTTTNNAYTDCMLNKSKRLADLEIRYHYIYKFEVLKYQQCLTNFDQQKCERKALSQIDDITYKLNEEIQTL